MIWNFLAVAAVAASNTAQAQAAQPCVPSDLYQRLGKYDYAERNLAYHGVALCNQAVATKRLPREAFSVERVTYDARYDAYIIVAHGLRSNSEYECKGIVNWIRSGGAVTQQGYRITWCGL